jgi:cytochrome c-type biogenesis protein
MINMVGHNFERRVCILTIILCTFSFYFIHASAGVIVPVEYYYMDGCSDCDHVKPLIAEVDQNLSGTISITYIDVGTPEGLELWQQYGFLEVPALVINGTIKIPKEEINQNRLETEIQRCLTGEETKENDLSVDWSIPLAYALGFFSGFSPCLMAILGFLLVYVAGTDKGMKSSILSAGAFGLGLVTAYLIIGICVLLIGVSFSGAENYLTFIAGLILILVGANLTGILKVPFSTEGFIKRSVPKYAASFFGLFFLGVLFSFVKVPCAAPLLLVLLSKILSDGTIQSLSLLIFFGAGVLTPFLGVGVLGGYESATRIRNHRRIIRVTSGLILIGVGLWMAFRIG